MSGVNGVKHGPFFMLLDFVPSPLCDMNVPHGLQCSLSSNPTLGQQEQSWHSWNILDFKSSWRRAVTEIYTEMIMFYGQLPLRYIYTLSWCCVFNLIDNLSLNYIKLLWYWLRFNSVLQRETLIGDNLGRSHLSVCFWALWQHNQTTPYSRKTFSLWQLRSIQRPGNPAHIHFPMGVGQILTGWRLLNPVFNFLFVRQSFVTLM